jgi:DNA-binding transcriptional LysR family regulator
MNLSHLRLFKAVADSLSLTKVSEQLHTSESSISHQLRVLQKKYSVTLYRKVNGGIELTTEGRLFLKDSQVILSDIEALERKLLSQKAVNNNLVALCVGASYGPSEALVPSLLARFKKRYPQAEVIFRTTDSWAIGQMILDSRVDIGLVNNVIRSPKFIIEPFSNEEVVLIASARSRLINRSTITLKEFASLPLIAREGRRGSKQANSSLDKLKKLGFAPNVVMRCDSLVAIKSAVENGMGVGLLSVDHIEGEKNHRTFKILRIPELQMKLERVVVYRKDKALSPIAAKFLELLRARKNM